MNTTTTTAAATASIEELKGLITEFDLDMQDYYGLSDKELAFADACCSCNTIVELESALRAGLEHWTCAGDCADNGLLDSEWLAGIRGALAYKVVELAELV